MKLTHRVFAVLLTLLLPAARAAAEAYTFARYQPILDRSPFGEVDRGNDEGRAPVPDLPPFTKDIKMCAINRDDLGVQVGFVNSAVKPPKAYLLRVGDTEDGITLVAADFEREVAQLAKDGRMEWISLSGNTASAPDQAPTLTRGPAPASPTSLDPAHRLSYAERLRMRREAIRVKPVKRPSLEGKELEEYLQKYQMDLIRKGEPPLPMQLTPEMDAQLVKEGVLPPLEGGAPAE